MCLGIAGKCMSDFFIPLGSGNEVGASAYYLTIDGINILLDGITLTEDEEMAVSASFQM